MELGTQIRKYRNERTLSQEALAEQVFVSRQTVSNWENDKSYPDVKSLMLLSEVFEVSLDQLIKGDVESDRSEAVWAPEQYLYHIVPGSPYHAGPACALPVLCRACHLDRDTGGWKLCGDARGAGEEKA